MRLTFFFFYLLISTACFGSGNYFVEGNQAFQAKDYETAIDAYEIHLQDYSFNRFEGFHNLGNAYYRVGNYPKAIINYERALLIQPNHKRLQHNLALANSKTIDQFATVDSFFIVSWWRNWRDLFVPNIWSMIALFTAFISAVALGFWRLGRNKNRRKVGFFIGFGSLFLLLLLLITTQQRITSMENPNTAIIMKNEVALKTASDENSPTIFMLQSGTKVWLEDELGSWQKVRLPNDDIGWLNKSVFEEI